MCPIAWYTQKCKRKSAKAVISKERVAWDNIITIWSFTNMHLFAYAVRALSCNLFYLLIYLWIYLCLPTYLLTSTDIYSPSTHIYLHLPTPAYIYLHLPTNLHLPTSTYIYLLLSTSIYIYLHLSTSIYIYLHLPTSAYIYLHLFTSVYIYLHLSTSIYIYLHLPTSIYIYLHLSTSIYIYLHLSTSTYYLHLSTSIYIYAYIYLHLSTSIYIYLHLSTSTYIYLHLPTSTYIYLHLPTAESAKDSYTGLAAGIVNIEFTRLRNSRCWQRKMEPLCVSCPQWRCSLGSTCGHHGLSNKDVIPNECSSIYVQTISAPVCGSTNLSPSKQRSIAQLSIRSFCSCSIMDPKDHPEKLEQMICSSFSGWSFGSVQLASVSCRDCGKKQLGAPKIQARMVIQDAEETCPCWLDHWTGNPEVYNEWSHWHNIKFHTIGLGPFNPCTLKTAATSHGQPSHSRAETCSSSHRGNITWASPNKKHH